MKKLRFYRILTWFWGILGVIMLGATLFIDEINYSVAEVIISFAFAEIFNIYDRLEQNDIKSK